MAGIGLAGWRLGAQGAEWPPWDEEGSHRGFSCRFRQRPLGLRSLTGRGEGK